MNIEERVIINGRQRVVKATIGSEGVINIESIDFEYRSLDIIDKNTIEYIKKQIIENRKQRFILFLKLKEYIKENNISFEFLNETAYLLGEPKQRIDEVFKILEFYK